MTSAAVKPQQAGQLRVQHDLPDNAQVDGLAALFVKYFGDDLLPEVLNRFPKGEDHGTVSDAAGSAAATQRS